MIYGLSKLANVHPKLWAAVGYLDMCSDYDWKILSGYRDPAEQDTLYAIGRTTNIGSPTVTDAHGGQSAHNFGLALDIVPTLDKGATTVTDTAHPAFAEKDTILSNLPFIQPVISTTAGRDYAHVQLRDWQNYKGWQESYALGAGILAFVLLTAATWGSR